MRSAEQTSAIMAEDPASEFKGSISLNDALYPTIFHEDWWLETATGRTVQVAEVMSGGRLVGRLPFHTTRRFGMVLMTMPVLTYFLGPAIVEGEGSAATRHLRRMQVTRELLHRLPNVSWQYIKCHGTVPDAIAFQELGFRTYVQFTHEIRPDGLDLLWSQMRDKTRNVVRRAGERFAVEQLKDPEEFTHLYRQNRVLNNIHCGVDREKCRDLIVASMMRQRGEILVARDCRGAIVAANFCVWDRESSYYMLATRSADSGNGGLSLLLWNAIKRSVERNLTFDFAGLGGQGSVLFYAGFGPVVKHRYVAMRASPAATLMHAAKVLCVGNNWFY